jgi:hypothetical protein
VGTLAAVKIMGVELPEAVLIEDKRGAGMPYLHDSAHSLLGKAFRLNLTTIQLDCAHLGLISDATHPCHPKNLKLSSTHAGHEKTQVPIYGVLTQPYTDEREDSDAFGNFVTISDSKEFLKNTFIKMSHVKYLEQGGARIVPVSYRIDNNQLNGLLT